MSREFAILFPHIQSQGGGCRNGLTVTSSGWPSKLTRFVDDSVLIPAAQKLAPHNRLHIKPARGFSPVLPREWQAGSLPYEDATDVVMLKKQLREDDETVRLELRRPSIRTVRWIERGRRFCFEGIDAHLSLLREMRSAAAGQSSLAGKVVRCPQCGGGDPGSNRIGRLIRERAASAAGPRA